MSAYLIEQIAGIENISVRTCCTVAGAQGDGHLEAVTLQDANTGERETLPGEPPVRVHRRRAAHRMAGRVGGQGRARASSRPARRC